MRIPPTVPRSLPILLVCLLVFAGCDRRQPDGAGAMAAPPPILVIDPETRLVIESGPHRAGEFERDRYFRTSQFPGLHGSAVNDALKALGAPPGRGTGPDFRMDGNPLEDGAARNEMDAILGRWTDFSLAAAAQFPGLAYAMAGEAEAWPEPWLAESPFPGAAPGRPGLQSAYFGAAADAVAGWLGRVKAARGLMPTYYSAANHPDMCFGDAGAFIAYHRTVAARLAGEFPELRITGPATVCSSPSSNFGRWERGWEGRFIDEAGDTVAAYDFQFLDTGRPQPAGEGRSESTRWDAGRLPAFLDMLASRHLARWGGEAPAVVVSEFGQSGPWADEFESLLHMNAIVEMWMTFFGRPEVVLAVPSVRPVGGDDDTERGPVLFRRDGRSSDDALKPTPFVRFYEMFTSLAGARVAARWDAPAETPRGILSIALRDGGKLRVLLHNARAFGEDFALRLVVPGAELTAARSIRWEGAPPGRADASAGRLAFDDRAESWTRDGVEFSSVLAGGETQLLTFDLGGRFPSNKVRTVRWQHVPVSVGELAPGAFADLGPPPAAPESVVRLRLGLARDGGFLGGVQVDTGAGWVVDVPHSASAGVKDYHGTLTFDWPPQARGPARVCLPDGGHLTSAVWEIETEN